MTQEYFYVRPSAIRGRYLTIDGDESKHIARVLRKKPGDLLWVVDGADHAYEVVVRSIDQHNVECEILYAHERHHEPDIEVTLAVAVLKNPSRMDWIIEKGTELGVRRYIPMSTARSVTTSTKEERWRNLALAAMKQSGRCFLPHIYPLTPINSVLRSAEVYDLRIIPYERTDEVLFIAEALRHRKPPSSAIILIGPEGGFTEEEIYAAEHMGFMQVSLGKRRLRTETAALVASSWVIRNY